LKSFEDLKKDINCLNKKEYFKNKPVLD